MFRTTRHRIGQRSHVLDLVFTLDEYAVSEITTTAGLGKSDHCILIFDLKVDGCLNVTDGGRKYIYDKADYLSMWAKLNDIDWSSEFSVKSVEESWTFFRAKLLDVFERYTPKRKQHVRQKAQPWIDSKTLKLIKEKHKQFRKWREMSSSKNCNKYSILEVEEQRLRYTRASNQSRWYCRKAVSEYEKYIASGVKKNAKGFWSYVKSKTTTRESVASLNTPEGSKTDSDQEKAEILQTFFSSVFTRESLENMPVPQQFNFDFPLSDIKVTSGDVFELLSK